MKNGFVTGAATGNMLTLDHGGTFTLPYPLEVHQQKSEMDGQTRVYLGHRLVFDFSKKSPGKWGVAYLPGAVTLRHLLADALLVCGQLYRNADYYGEVIAQGAREAERYIIGYLTSPPE